MKYHCLECGAELIITSCNESTDKYHCPGCNKNWFRVRHIIVEWVKER